MNTLPQIQFFKSPDGSFSLEVPVQGESVWLNESQLALLFGRDRSVIAKHIRHALTEELDKNQVCAIFAHTAGDGKKYQVQHYNLDVIISLGYRVKSKKGVIFRKWANKVLKQYLIEGYALNETKLAKTGISHLQSAISLLTATLKSNQLIEPSAFSVLDIIQKYAKTWDVLLQYDESRLEIPPDLDKNGLSLTLTETHKLIQSFKKELISIQQATDLFGKEKDKQLDSILGSLNQTFGGEFLYKTAEERAAHLLYLTIKDHPFLDGNKRIGSFLFTSFLIKAKIRPVDPQSLVALTLLIAESNPQQKDLMIKLIINLMTQF